MADVMLIFPERKMDALAERLCDLTEAISKRDPDIVAHGFLGGTYGYGARYDCDVFQMEPYCWCDRQGCPWCGGCECETVPTVDGADVSFDEWMAFYDRERARGVAAGKINKRRSHRLVGEKCDYCSGRGVFATHGSRPGKGAPNFWHKPSGLRVWWYKYIGRGMKAEGRPPSLDAVFSECIAALAPGIEAEGQDPKGLGAEHESPKGAQNPSEGGEK